MSKILTIPDCHVSDDDDLERFKYLGKFIVEQKPEYIVFMGDFLTLKCLSAWDMNKRKTMEGKRYKNEINKGNEALDIIFKPLKNFNKKKRKNKEKMYRPKIYFLEGNHCQRLERYLEQNPTFDGFANIEQDLKLKERDVEFVPYREYIFIDDIAFTHIVFNKAREVSGIGIARKISMQTFFSIICAHTHTFTVENFKRHGQDKLQQIMTVGCYFEEVEDYMRGHIIDYWPGLTLLETFGNGRFDFQTFSIEKLRKDYEK